MMSEKRFTLDDEENGLCRCILVDGEEMPTCEICDLLNEQQATIEQFRQEIEEWKKENRELLDKIQEFKRIPKSIRELWVE